MQENGHTHERIVFPKPNNLNRGTIGQCRRELIIWSDYWIFTI
jgi:hypothetical protein